MWELSIRIVEAQKLAFKIWDSFVFAANPGAKKPVETLLLDYTATPDSFDLIITGSTIIYDDITTKFSGTAAGIEVIPGSPGALVSLWSYEFTLHFDDTGDDEITADGFVKHLHPTQNNWDFLLAIWTFLSLANIEPWPTASEGAFLRYPTRHCKRKRKQFRGHHRWQLWCSVAFCFAYVWLLTRLNLTEKKTKGKSFERVHRCYEVIDGAVLHLKL